MLATKDGAMTTADVETLARELLAEHMPATADRWRIEWGDAKRLFGVCYPRRRIIRFSRYLIVRASAAEMRNTVIHEVAHAIAGPGVGHGAKWRRIERALGGNGDVRHSIPQEVVDYKWRTECPNGHTGYRNRRDRVACGRCTDVFDERYLLTYTPNR